MSTALVADTTPIANGYDSYSNDEMGNLFHPINNPGIDRVFRGDDGRKKVHIWNGKFRPDGTRQMGTVDISYIQSRYQINRPTWNAATSLRKMDWIQIDREVLEAYRLERVVWPDLESFGTYGGFNGMAKSILETETASDPGQAMVDMNALSEGRSDRPLFQAEGLPLTITHVDFWYDLRTLTISRNGGGPGLDTRSAGSGGARISETLEKTLLGIETGPTYGGTRTFPLYSRNSSVYGYTNFSPRLTKTNLYKPTGNGRAGTGWVPSDTLKDVLAMIDTLRINKFNGPFVLYHSNDWDQYLDNDYILTGGNVATQTLRKRLEAIPAIGPGNVKNVPFLAASATTYANDPANITTANPWTMILVSKQSRVARAVNGMDVTTVQWEEKGGMKLCFKIMCIKVPQLFADFYGYCGILHSNASSGV